MNLLHPITETLNDLIKSFTSEGFSIEMFPEIRTDEEEFESVGIYKENPVRDYGRTIYIDDQHVLQAHLTSIRDTVKNKNKFGKYVIPGRIYRVNREDLTHNYISHQLEGIIFGVQYSLADFNDLMERTFINMDFPRDTLISTTDFTIFTSPTIQYYYECYQCHGKGCKLCSNKGKICYAAGGLEYNSWDKENNCGNISFCISVDRLAMLRYQIPDARLLYEG